MHLVVAFFTYHLGMVLAAQCSVLSAIAGMMARGHGVGMPRCAVGCFGGGGGAHVDGGDDGDGFLCDVHPGEDSSGLADAWQPLRQQLWGQVVQVQVQVVLPSGNAPFIER